METKKTLDLLVGAPLGYIFVDGHPVDNRNDKYRIFRKWLKLGKLKCFGCGREPHSMKLTKCKGAGAIHEAGTKHHFHLIAVNTKGKETNFTLDHWIPKSFLLKLKQLFDFKIKNNLVPMCANCNNDKAAKMPKDFKWGVTRYKPEISIIRAK